MNSQLSHAIAELRAEAAVAEVPIHLVKGVLLEAGVVENDIENATRSVLMTLVVNDGMRVCDLVEDFAPWPEEGRAAYERLVAHLSALQHGPPLFLVARELLLR